MILLIRDFVERKVARPISYCPRSSATAGFARRSPRRTLRIRSFAPGINPGAILSERKPSRRRVGDGNRQQPQDGGVGVVVVVAHGGIVPPRSERVLREV